MPIYAYRCTSCGHAKDVLQKISDPQLSVCPSCGAETFVKQLTAAGFQLKGSGWYVTDFRNGSGSAGSATSTSSAAPASGDAAAPAASTAPASSSSSSSGGDGGSSTGGCGSSCACH